MGMAPYVRREQIERADELLKFARSIFNEKRSEALRKVSKMYKECDLTLLAEKIEKEAETWENWSF